MMEGMSKYQREILLGMIDIIKKQSEQFKKILQPDMKKYMLHDNVFVLTKLSNVFKDDKVYLLEIDTSVSIQNPSLLDYDLLQSYLTNNGYDKLIFWSIVYDQEICSVLPNKLTTSTEIKNVGNFIYMEFEQESTTFNFQQSFNREFSFVEHLSSNKWWTREHFQDQILMPSTIKKMDDIVENKIDRPDFVVKDVELDAGKGIFLLDKDDYQESFERLYCEEFIDSDFHFNTYHLCGKHDTIDITNYNNIQPTNFQYWERLEKKSKFSYGMYLDLHTYYKSNHSNSPEYLSLSKWDSDKFAKLDISEIINDNK